MLCMDMDVYSRRVAWLVWLSQCLCWPGMAIPIELLRSRLLSWKEAAGALPAARAEQPGDAMMLRAEAHIVVAVPPTRA